VLLLIGICVAGGALAKHAAATGGQDPFTPTKLEWLVLTLNARDNNIRTKSGGTVCQFLAEPPDTTRLVIWYHAEVSAKDLEEAVTACRASFAANVSHYGWKWARVVEERSPLPAN